jgi:hypothetical protein
MKDGRWGSHRQREIPSQIFALQVAKLLKYRTGLSDVKVTVEFGVGH